MNSLSDIYDDNPGGASVFIHNCDAPDVAYHLVYDTERVSLDHTATHNRRESGSVDGAPALNGHYLVDIIPLYDESETPECFVSSGRQTIPLSGSQELGNSGTLNTASSPLSAFPRHYWRSIMPLTASSPPPSCILLSISDLSIY